MNRIATTFAIVLLSAGAAAAQGELVTRSEPAELYVLPSELALLPAETVTLTTGTQARIRAAEVLSPQELALTGLDAGDTVPVTVMQGNAGAISIR